MVCHDEQLCCRDEEKWELVNDKRSTGEHRIRRWHNVDECDSRSGGGATAAVGAQRFRWSAEQCRGQSRDQHC